MPFRFHCEHCDVRIKVPDGSEGKKVKCPGCNHVQRVPRGAAVPAVSAVVPDRNMRQESHASQAIDEPRETKSAPAQKKTAEAAQSKARNQTTTKREGAGKSTAPSLVDAVSSKGDEHDAASDVEPSSATRDQAIKDAPAPGATSGNADVAASAPDTSEAMRAFLAQMGGGDSHVDELPPVASSAVHGDEIDGESQAASGSEAHASTVPESSKSDALSDASYKDTSAAATKDEVDLPFDIPADAIATPSMMSQPIESTLAPEDAASAASPADDSADSETASDSASSGDAPEAASVVSDDAAADELQTGDEPEEVTGPVSMAGEAPAGEVRDLFDDFVRREAEDREFEASVRESKDQSDDTRSAARANPTISVSASSGAQAPANESAGAASRPSVGEPVVVVKVPARVTRSAIPVARSKTASSAQPSHASDSLSASRLVQAPQAISLSSARSESEAKSADAEEVVDAQRGDQGESQATAAAPVARQRRLAPLPGYTTLLALCWILRLLACVSLVSLVKIALLWIDAGAKVMDAVIIAPLGLGIVMGIWALGEVARATRDAVRNSCR